MYDHFLTVTSGPAAGQRLAFDQELVIGREGEDSATLSGDPEISRRHARLTRAVDGTFEVEDLGSTNGTFLNGVRLHARSPLTTGDVLALGETTIKVERFETTAVKDQPNLAPPAPAPPPDPAVVAPAVSVPSPAPSPTAVNGIVVEGLVRNFGKDRAVDGIDLHVDPGEIYGFLGPNGAGKSTTVHMLTTLLPPSGGHARVCGFDIAAEGPKVRRVIGVALQAVALDGVLTGREHMTLQTALDGIPKAERRAWGDSLLERVGLTNAADRRTGKYSGGMKRRLDLALALVKRPRVLFLDEPTTGLDPQSRSALWDEVARLAHEDGVTIFLTTQYLEEADQLAGRVGIIESGRIVAEGTPAQLKAEIGRPTVEAVPTTEADARQVRSVLSQFGELTGVGAHKGVAVRLRQGIDGLADIVRALDSAGLRLSHLSLHEPTLDDVFLTKTGRSLDGAAHEAEQGSRLQAALSFPGSPVPKALADQARHNREGR